MMSKQLIALTFLSGGKKMKSVLQNIALALVIIGGLNWLLVGLFSFDLVQWITYGVRWLANTIYIVVGISALYALTIFYE